MGPAFTTVSQSDNKNLCDVRSKLLVVPWFSTCSLVRSLPLFHNLGHRASSDNYSSHTRHSQHVRVPVPIRVPVPVPVPDRYSCK